VIARLAVLAALVVAASGCGGEDPPETASTPAPSPTSSASGAAAESTPAASGSAANAFIGSIAVDPRDGAVMLGTGLGLFRMEPGAREAKRVIGELTTPDGSGQVSSNLVVRYARPGELLASGHPEGGSLPENLGLIRSADGGRTWESVSELGDTDHHILQVAGKHVIAVEAEGTAVRVSTDGGRTYDARTAPGVPLDAAFDPSDPTRMAAATQEGVFTSSDEGVSWRPRDGIPSEQLAWAAPDELYRADPGGLIKVSADGGASWKDRGTIGGTANELAGDADGALYASMPGGKVVRSTDGGATWRRLVVLK
jgi:hypothetical protein